MTDDPDHKRETAAAFGDRVANYRESTVHQSGGDLDRLAGWCADATRALDVATGPGHAAGALADAGVPTVIATDASPAMVAGAVTTDPAVRGVVADAERLPFAADAFDAAVCRIAAHHFPTPEAFVGEVARVLEPGGVFAFEDNVAPEHPAVAAFLDRLERLHDPTHVEARPTGAWVDWLSAAGFAVEETVRLTKPIPFDEWVAGTPDGAADQDRLRRLLLDAPDEVASALAVDVEDGAVRSFAPPKVLLRAVTAP